MTNNDIFKKLRVALMLRDDQIVEILELVDFRMSKGEIGNFFRNEDHPKYVACGDQVLRNFLNGLVIYLRGTKENPQDPMTVIAQNKATAAAPRPKTDTKAQAKTPQAKGSKPNKNKKPGMGEVMGKVQFKNGKNKKS
ncbi:MAG: DUF1456 family protein [Bacteroidetes bacterium]|nr:DUF1456 family protein [Bacteroidota bacterium]